MRKKLDSLSAPGCLIPAYALAMAVWFGLWLTVGDSHWLLVLVNRFVFYLFLPAPLLLILTTMLRERKPAWSLLIPILIALFLYHPYIVPKRPVSVTDSLMLRVMTYNVLYSNLDYDAMAATIQANQPDLIALQEVLPETMAQLQTRLQEHYPYSVLGVDKDFGTSAVFSRFPFTATKVLDLQAPRPATVIRTTVGDQEVVFIAVHLLAYNLWWTKLPDIPATVMERTVQQNHQVELLLNEIVDEEGIVILGCDCNSYETSSSYRMLDQVLDNSARNIDVLAALDLPAPVKRDLYPWHIDYVWYKGDILPLGTYKVSDSGGSDHLPVLAVFLLPAK